MNETNTINEKTPHVGIQQIVFITDWRNAPDSDKNYLICEMGNWGEPQYSTGMNVSTTMR